MATILALFCFHSNWPYWLHVRAENSKEYLFPNEACESSMIKDKRILKWSPFMKVVYES